MDYEQKYKELIGKIEKAYLFAQTDSTKAVLEDICPELKGSQDERIRKEIIVYLKGGTPFSTLTDKWRWINWLEKQGEKPQGKSIIKAWKDMRFEVYAQASGNRHEPNCSDNNTEIFSLNDIDEIIEKISMGNIGQSGD